MNPFLRNILAVIAGVVAGSFVNGTLIAASASVIPPPPGTDTSTMEGLKASMHFFAPRHFLMPFLAHALGTLAGALVATLIAANKKMRPAMIVAVLFLVAGIINVVLLPAPVWFSAIDLMLAYIPMGLIGARLAGAAR